MRPGLIKMFLELLDEYMSGAYGYDIIAMTFSKMNDLNVTTNVAIVSVKEYSMTNCYHLNLQVTETDGEVQFCILGYDGTDCICMQRDVDGYTEDEIKRDNEKYIQILQKYFNVDSFLIC